MPWPFFLLPIWRLERLRLGSQELGLGVWELLSWGCRAWDTGKEQEERKFWRHPLRKLAGLERSGGWGLDNWSNQMSRFGRQGLVWKLLEATGL